MIKPVRPYKRRTKVQLFWDIFWAIWLAMLLIGDPIASWVFGEKASDIAWIAWHFLVAHQKT